MCPALAYRLIGSYRRSKHKISDIIIHDVSFVVCMYLFPVVNGNNCLCKKNLEFRVRVRVS